MSRQLFVIHLMAAAGDEEEEECYSQNMNICGNDCIYVPDFMFNVYFKLILMIISIFFSFFLL